MKNAAEDREDPFGVPPVGVELAQAAAGGKCQAESPHHSERDLNIGLRNQFAGHQQLDGPLRREPPSAGR